jgi:hypothetical protein
MNDFDTVEPITEWIGPTASTLKALASQLEQWRGMLPEALKWPDDDPAVSTSERYLTHLSNLVPTQHSHSHSLAKNDPHLLSSSRI